MQANRFFMNMSYRKLILPSALIVLASCGSSSEKIEAEKFIPGQIWHYDTRPGEESSTLTILKIDSFPEDGKIVHIRLDGLNVQNPMAPEGFSQTADHLPMKFASLDSSVTTLISADNAIPEFMSGYKLWRKEYDKDSAGVFNVSVKKTVQYLEEAMGNAQPVIEQ